MLSNLYRRHSILILLVIAFIVLQLPFVSIPLKWLESYFHELSHGLAALVSGGEIISIQLFLNGAGLCTTRGGSTLLISFMGYAGAALWGGGLYYLFGINGKLTQICRFILLLILAISIILWVRDLLTFIIIASITCIIALSFKIQNIKYLQVSLQLIALVVLLNSLLSPWYLIDGRHLGDGARLAQLTMLPEVVWVAVWFLIGVSVLFYLIKSANKKAVL